MLSNIKDIRIISSKMKVSLLIQVDDILVVPIFRKPFLLSYELKIFLQIFVS